MCIKSLKVNRRNTGNAMYKRTRKKGQSMFYKIPHRKLKSKLHENQGRELWMGKKLKFYVVLPGANSGLVKSSSSTSC